jgi:CRP/FNR family transcriptional regulator
MVLPPAGRPVASGYRGIPYDTREPPVGRNPVTGEVTHSLVKALRSVPDFAGLDDRALLQVVGASMNLAFQAGSTVFEEGSPGEALCVVLSGEVRIIERDDGRETEVARVGPGESFGEFSLMLRTVHTKTAEAVQDTELLMVPFEMFEEVLATNEELAAGFRARLEARQPIRGQVEESA